LFARPRQFAGAWDKRADPKVSSKEALGWSFAVAALLFGLYSAIAHQSVSERVREIAFGPPIRHEAPAERAPSPALKGIFWTFGAGVGVSLPQGIQYAMNEPQLVIFRMGAVEMLFANVVPSKLGTKVCELLIVNLYLYLGMICLYPACRIWGRTVTFKTAVGFANLFLATIWAAAAIWCILALLLFGELLRLREDTFMIAWAIAVDLPLAVILVRASWGGFRTLFGLSRIRFLVSLVVAWAISWFICPIAAPAIYLILGLQPILDVVI
jgi:hypothetical protein